MLRLVYIIIKQQRCYNNKRVIDTNIYVINYDFLVIIYTVLNTRRFSNSKILLTNIKINGQWLTKHNKVVLLRSNHLFICLPFTVTPANEIAFSIEYSVIAHKKHYVILSWQNCAVLCTNLAKCDFLGHTLPFINNKISLYYVLLSTMSWNTLVSPFC